MEIAGWNGNNPIFRDLIEKYKPTTIVEVGSWQGQSAINMAKICKELGLNTTIYCIDTWLGALEFYTQPSKERDLMLEDGYPTVYYKFLDNVRKSGVEDVIKPIPLPSNIGLKYIKHLGIKPDMIYIDASHEYEDVKNDIILAGELEPKIIFGDDYTNAVFPGVRQAVDELGTPTIVNNWFWIL